MRNGAQVSLSWSPRPIVVRVSRLSCHGGRANGAPATDGFLGPLMGLVRSSELPIQPTLSTLRPDPELLGRLRAGGRVVVLLPLVALSRV